MTNLSIRAILERRRSLWVPKTVSPHMTWAYWWLRPPSRSRRRTRPAVPSSARRVHPGYTAGTSEVQRPGPFRHFRATGFPRRSWRRLRIVSTVHASPGPGSPLSRNLRQVRGDHLSPHWSRPSGFHVCSMFARMSRYHAVAPVSGRHCASGDCRLLIRGFGVRVPGGEPVLTWHFTRFRPRR